MKQIIQDNNQYALRFDRGEEVIEGIRRFCGERGIRAGHFTVIGACEAVTYAYYHVEKKEYERRELRENVEILGVIGNVAMLRGQAAVHAHGTFGHRDMKVTGGHVERLTVSGTAEAFLTVFAGEIRRAFDEETGLNLMR